MVDYDSLPAAIWQRIAPHFGIELDAGMRERVAKTPSRAFRPDGAAKRARANAGIRTAAARWVAPALERVRALPRA